MTYMEHSKILPFLNYRRQNGPTLASVTDEFPCTEYTMPWSFALPQAVFGSPILSVATPLTTGSLVGYLVNRE